MAKAVPCCPRATLFRDHLGRRVPLKTSVLVTDPKVVVLLERDQAISIVSTLAVITGMVAR
jgi:hypothetical protein